MPTRHRQFFDLRSSSCSRRSSPRSSQGSNRLKSSIKASSQIQTAPFNQSKKGRSSFQPVSEECVTCVNKKLSEQRQRDEKIKKQQQISEHRKTIRAINSMRDMEKEKRQRQRREAAIYNLSMIEYKQLQKTSSKQSEPQYIQDLLKRQSQKEQTGKRMRQSRRQEEKKYYQALKQQAQAQKKRKQQEKRRQQIQYSGNLKLIEDNCNYVKKVEEESRKCNSTVRAQLTESSLRKMDEKDRRIQEEMRHIEKVESDFQQFSENQSLDLSPYKKSRTMLNPEEIQVSIYNSQQRKKQQNTTQRNLNNEQRIRQLRQQAEQSRRDHEKKLRSMKEYVEDLKSQVLSRRQREAQEKAIDQKRLKQGPARTDAVYTEFMKEVQVPCKSCHQSKRKACY